MAALNRIARRDVLAATPIFAPMARPELEALADLATERRVRKDETVIRRGDTDASLMVLVHGRLRAGIISVEGREVVLGLMEAGTVLGEIALLDGQPRSLDVVAMVDSLLLVVERRGFLPFLTARPDLMLRLMALLCDRVRASSAAYEGVALTTLSARLARLLLGLAATHGQTSPDGIRIGLKLSQRDMSAQVAATRERVNKQLRAWHEAGILAEQDGHLVIRQLQELRNLTEGGVSPA